MWQGERAEARRKGIESEAEGVVRPTNPNLDLLEQAAEQLGKLLDELVLVGGCAAGLLVTDPGSSPIRPTEDVDLVVEATTYGDYHRFGERLSKRGFRQGTRPGDPICRWRKAELTLDIMPLDENILGFSNRWYLSAIQWPGRTVLPSGISLKHIDAPHFLATKLSAFQSRGAGDYLTSADLEDVVIVVDGRRSIEEELQGSESQLQSYVAEHIQVLLAQRHFMEALPGHFAGGPQVAERMRALIERLEWMAALG